MPVHWTQVPEEQTFFPEICEQSESAEQVVQVFVVVSQRDTEAFVQSVFARHETHVVVDVLQTDFEESLQSELAKQPS